MIRQAIAFSVAMILAASVQAQTIVARSGEHDGFTRLVMRLPNNADWSLTQNGQRATLKIDAPEAVIDTSNVFSRIPRERLKDLRQDGAGQPLRLQLGCDCEIKSYVQRDGYLVIDIRDGKGARTYTSTSGVLPLSSALIGAGYRFNLSQGAVTDARGALNLAAAMSQRSTSVALSPSAAMAQPTPEPRPAETVQPKPKLPLHSQPEPEQEQATLPQVDLLLDLDETARAAAVNVSEQRLLQQIGRATNQGLLDLVMAEVNASDAPTVIAQLSTQDRPMNPLDHLAVTTAVDRDLGLMPLQEMNAADQNLCIQSRDLALYNWGQDTSFSDQIGPLRSSLFKEFDHIDTNNVLLLAKTYLHFGFGAEARAMLDMLPSSAAQSDVLNAMAVLLDGGDLPINHPFAGQQGCDSDAAFWAVLADGTMKKSANTDAIQQTLARMPVHLRVHMGPKISTLSAQSGDQHMAAAALRSVDRTGVDLVPDINLAQAAIATLVGDTEAVAEELTEELAGRTENSPRALIDLIFLSFEERKALSPDLPDLVASYELESRDGSLGADLRKAEVIALSMTGQFPEAFSALASMSEQDGPMARAAASEPVMTLLTERADDVTFLQYALLFAEQATAKEALPVAEEIARRLLKLGFYAQTQSMLMKLALEPTNESRRLMMAEAALGLELPHRALVELMGLDGSEANRLRAQALWRNGEFNRASEYFLAEQDTDGAARGFWHSENLDSIVEDEDGQFSQVAAATTELELRRQNPADLPPLANARALVTSSVDTRESIATLLQRVMPESDLTQ